MDLKSFLQPPQREGKKYDLAEYRFFTFANLIFIIAVAVHFILIFIFLNIGLNIMAYINVFSVLIFLFAIYLVRKHLNFLFSSMLASVEINAHAALAVYFLGLESGFQYFILILVLVAYFFPNLKVAVLVTIFSLVHFIVLLILFTERAPQFYVSAATINLFNIFLNASTIIVIAVAAYVFRYVVDQTEGLLNLQYNRAERLLRNILPVSVGERLKEKERLIADSFPQASILFADLQNFTEFAGSTDPEKLVYTLNELFSSFDDLLEQNEVEKIKTIGDAYMVASGLPQESSKHAEQITDYALAMLSAVNDFNKKQDLDFSVRIGINSGPVIAGVVGKKKYAYDLWGDTVNVAARMETSGAPGQIHLSDNTYRLISDKYNFTRREPLKIKGKGLMQTYLLKPD
jgi:adenylate cyclase